MTTVQIAGQSVRLKANQVIGKGGEADIFRITPDTVLKLYKKPSDPDYVGQVDMQRAATRRLKEQQRKLPLFPGVPQEVVGPQELAYSGNELVGFTMSYVSGMDVLMQFGNRIWRESSGLSHNQVVDVFRELHRVVNELHRANVVIGDFNDLNVLSDGTSVRLVDADSMQFGGFACQTYTTRFIDPLLAEADRLVLARPHNELSDWYAYFVMLLQSLLYVGPYGGVHRPVGGKRLQHDERVLRRLTFVSPEVVYPKPALALGMIPDDMQAYLELVTKQDKREIFPPKLLDGLRFTTCTSCGALHARPTCPQCQAPGVVRQTLTIRGQVTARRVFQTRGRVVQAAMQNGQLHYLYEEGGSLYREGDRRLMNTALTPELRFRLRGDQTLIARGSMLLSVSRDGEISRRTVDSYRHRLPMFDTNSESDFWSENGQLLQSGRLGPLYLGDILSSQTLFWAGEKLGFGFYQAGQLTRGFVFRPGVRGLNDQVDIGAVHGQLVDATCIMGDDRAWFFTSVKEQGALMHRLRVFDARGALLAQAEARADEDSWLGQDIRGHLATGTSLFAATDDGLVRLGVENGQVVVERTFPDTEPFVSAENWLLPGPGGIYVVSLRDITLLTIK